MKKMVWNYNVSIKKHETINRKNWFEHWNDREMDTSTEKSLLP